jgi:hypothetical protein
MDLVHPNDRRLELRSKRTAPPGLLPMLSMIGHPPEMKPLILEVRQTGAGPNRARLRCRIQRYGKCRASHRVADAGSGGYQVRQGRRVRTIRSLSPRRGCGRTAGWPASEDDLVLLPGLPSKPWIDDVAGAGVDAEQPRYLGEHPVSSVLRACVSGASRARKP